MSLIKCGVIFLKGLLKSVCLSSTFQSAKDEDFISLMQFPQEKKPKSETTATITKDNTAASFSPPTSQIAFNHQGSPQAKVAKGSSSPTPKPEIGTSKPQPVIVPDGAMRRVKTESYLTSLTTKEYFERKERERKERERKERERIEKERQKIVERKETSLQQREQHEQQSGQTASDKSETRQHTNIFDQLISEKQRTEMSMDVVDSSMASRTKHSLERSHAQHNYKERYHHKERSDKMPFSPEAQKELGKTGSHRPPPSQRPNPTNVGHQSRDPKQKNRAYDRRYTEHRQHAAPTKEHPKHDFVKSSIPDVKPKASIQEAAQLVTEASPEKIPVEAKVQKLDPEEGEILDDDSPLGGVQAQKVDKLANQREGDRGYHYHHRERRLSGRHQSPGAALPTPASHTKVPAQEGRVRHRSPRSTHPPLKEEAQVQAARENKAATAPKFEVTVPEPSTKLPDIESLHSKALEEPSLIKQATPEPGEIVEHGQKHHHKSSRSKGHKKDKHRDRESSHDSGSLKIKLDLKGMGAVPSATKPPTAGSGDDRKKEIKLKIKPPMAGVVDGKETQDLAAGLKMKLKVPTVLSPAKGNGDVSKPETKEHHKSANAIKLTLSKDSQSGQFTAHGSSHKSHRHSSAVEKSSSRKRPYSPSETTPSTHHKLARNDSGLAERHHANDLAAGLLSDSGTSSPLASAGGTLVHPALVEDVQRQLHRLIEKKTEEIQQQKLVVSSSSSSKKPHHDSLNNPNAAFPPSEPSQTLPPHS